MYGWSAAKRRAAGEEDGEEGRGQDMKGSAAHSIKCGFNSKYGKQQSVGLEKQCDQTYKYLYICQYVCTTITQQ